jgi:hypothetical protein
VPASEDLAPAQRVTTWTALRRDPGHAPELCVLCALPQLSPQVTRWWSTRPFGGTVDHPEQLSRSVLRRSTRVARRGGAITGSSFYVAMVPAMVMIYCEQLAALLRIAAIYGRDPGDPARAAEILVIQGRYPTLGAARAALQKAGTKPTREHQSKPTASMAAAVRQVPSMIGLQVRRLKTPIDVAIVIVEVASFLVPVVSIPVWAAANARATRRLGRAAISFYSQPSTTDSSTATLVLPSPPTRRQRRQFVATLVPLAAALGVLAAILPFGRYTHNLRWAGLVLAELALILTFARLVRITRPANTDTAKKQTH